MRCNYLRLAENLQLNHLEGRVRIYQVGLSDCEATLDISLREDFSGGSTTGNAAIVIDDSDLVFRSEKITVHKLDDLGSLVPLTGLDFIKVDIEGHEDKFLNGASATIGKYRPLIYLEINNPYYRRRGLDPTTVFESWAAAANYVYALRLPIGWKRGGIRNRRTPIDNALALPMERADAVLSQLNRQ